MTASGDYGLTHQLETVERADGRQDVDRVGALPPARLERAERPAALEQPVEQALLDAALDQVGAELAWHQGIEAGIGPLQPEDALPVDPGAHRPRAPPVGQVLAELQQGGQLQPPRREPGLAALGEEVAKSASAKMGPSSSRSLRSALPLRKAALAVRAVPSGTGSIGPDLSDMVGLRGGSAIDPRDMGRPAAARFRQQCRLSF
jgi:hypothetical protein